MAKRSRRYRDSIIHHDTILEEKGLSVYQAALAYISTIIGAGIVSLPYAMLEAGYMAGLFLHFMTTLILLFCVFLYLKAKDNLGYE
jgi:amino acid permease